MAKELSKWAQDEINNAKFVKSESLTRRVTYLRSMTRITKLMLNYMKRSRMEDAS